MLAFQEVPTPSCFFSLLSFFEIWDHKKLYKIYITVEMLSVLYVLLSSKHSYDVWFIYTYFTWTLLQIHSQWPLLKQSSCIIYAKKSDAEKYEIYEVSFQEVQACPPAYQVIYYDFQCCY